MLKQSKSDILRSEGLSIAEQLEMKGHARGRAEGHARGRVEGRVEGRNEIVANMLALGLTEEQVSQYTGVPMKEIHRGE